MLLKIFSILVLLDLRVFSNSCTSEVSSTLTKALPPLEYFYLSGKGVNDLGRYNECIEAKEGKYALIVADYLQVHIMLGVCVPEVCKTSEIQNAVVSVLSFIDNKNLIDTKSIEIIYPKEYSEKSIPLSSIFFLILGSIYIKMIAYGTYLDLKSSDKAEQTSSIKKIFLEMSLQKSYSQFVQTTPIQDPLQILNGIRVIASSTILSLHVLIFAYRAAFSDTKNTVDSSKDFSHKFIFLFFYNVDVFFFMSGLLMCYLTISAIEKAKGKISWGQFILKRFIRYSPIYYFTITIGIFLLRYLGSGPQWPMAEKIHPACDDCWWSSYLYLNNLIPYKDFGCLAWVWYVCADFQFYLISPLILVIYLKNKTAGYGFCLLLMLGSFLYIGIISDEYELTPTFNPGWADKNQYGLIYNKPFSRISPFLIGVVVAWIYKNHKDSEKNKADLLSPKNNTYGDVFERVCLSIVGVERIRKILYLAGVALIIWVNFIVEVLDRDGQDEWTQNQKSAYLVFHRFLFTLGFSFLVFPMMLGYCGQMKSFLSLPIFQVLARSSYSLYMIHPLLLIYFSFSRSQAIITDGFYLFVTNVCLFAIAHIISIIVTIVVELPLLSLERKYLRG